MVGKVGLLRHHVTHGAGFECSQFSFSERRFRGLKDLSYRSPGKRQLRPLVGDRQNRSRGRRIETDGTPKFGVPKLRRAGRRHPRSLDYTDKTILTFDGRFVAVIS